jgi:hypothetical protein
MVIIFSALFYSAGKMEAVFIEHIFCNYWVCRRSVRTQGEGSIGELHWVEKLTRCLVLAGFNHFSVRSSRSRCRQASRVFGVLSSKFQGIAKFDVRENTSVTKERLQRARSCLRCALQFSICSARFSLRLKQGRLDPYLVVASGRFSCR